MDARNNLSFCVSFRKCHLTHQDTTCPPPLALDPWRKGRVLERSLVVQDDHMDARNNFFLVYPSENTLEPIKIPPVIHLSSWILGGQEGFQTGVCIFMSAITLLSEII